MKVIYAPQAIEDVEAYVRHVAAHNAEAAMRIAQRIFAVIGQLADGAFEGPEQRLRSGEPVRSWPVHPLRIYYRRTANALQVLRVYHQARQPIVK